MKFVISTCNEQPQDKQQSTPSNLCLLELIPDCVLTESLSYLDGVSLAKTQCVSVNLSKLSSNSFLWMRLVQALEDKYSVIQWSFGIKKDCVNSSYQSAYQKRLEWLRSLKSNKANGNSWTYQWVYWRFTPVLMCFMGYFIIAFFAFICSSLVLRVPEVSIIIFIIIPILVLYFILLM